MKPKLTAVGILLSITLNIHAQNQKEVYGSFEAGCKVFNYHFKQASNQINAFTISEIGKGLQLFSLEEKKLDTTLKFFDSLTKKIDNAVLKLPDSSDDKQNFTNLKSTITILKSVVMDVSEKVNALLKLSDKKTTIDSLNKKNQSAPFDSSLTKINGSYPGSDFYSVSSILKALTTLYEEISGQQPARYTYFNEFRQDVFENVFLSYMNPYKSSFSAVCPPDLIRLSSQVFGTIKARLDFFDDEPITAYLKLKDKKIRVYIRNERTDPESNKKQKATDEENNASASTSGNNKRNRGQDTIATKKNNSKKTNDRKSSDKNYIPQPFLIEERDYLNMEVSNVSVEFEDGNIKNIYADLIPFNKKGEKGFPVRFRNNKPVSISNKFDPENFEFNKIFAGKPCEVYRFVRNRGIGVSGRMQEDEDINKTTNCKDLFFILSDLLEYLVVAESDKEDYSPANRVYDLNEQNPVQQLKKEKRSKILVVKAFSDFVGIRDDQPNGLIQFEASKRINIFTGRRQLNITDYDGTLTFIEPAITFSKLEHNNKYLYLDKSTLDTTLVGKTGAKAFEVDPLQIYQYANFSIKTDLNLYKFNWSKAKSNLQLNARFGFLRTGVSDSVKVKDSAAVAAPDLDTDNINSRLLGIGLVWEFKPDSRYGISFGYEVQYIKPFSENYNVKDGYNKPIQTFYFDGYLNTNNDGGRLFFRTRFNQLIAKKNRNFMQIQMGYAINVFKAQ